MALLAQAGLSPYAYPRTLIQSGLPYAGPPHPGDIAAHSHVPELVCAATGSGGAATGSGGTAAVAAAADQGDEEESLIFSDMGSLPNLAGPGDGDGGETEADGLGGDGGIDGGTEGAGAGDDEVSPPAPTLNDPFTSTL